MIQTETSPPPNQLGVADQSRLRQIAILLHTLPDRTHRALLGQLDQIEKQRVLSELETLGDVDPLEQFRVLKSMRDLLQTETRRVESVESEIQDEIQIGRARVSKKRPSSAYQSSESESPTLRFSDRPTATTPSQLSQSSDSEPATSGNSETAPESIANQESAQPSVQMTPEALHQLISQFRQTQAAGALPKLHQSMSSPATSMNESADVQHHNRLPINGSDYSRPTISLEEARRRKEREAERRAKQIDELLMRIEPTELCGALGSVSTKQAFLVLCGLPNDIAEKLLAMLPRRQSRKVRADMRRMGQLQLADIDAAKREVAAVIIRKSTHFSPVAA